INRRHWEQTARDLGMRPRFVVEEVRRLTDSIEQSLPEIRRVMEAQHGELSMLQQPEAVVRQQIHLARNPIE
ncbi:MAG: hypothetical protein V2J42_12000, partial [Wenzhouxiangella sp.]|nr:hypothetical protein [Wenzhouxiangella sp.]